VQRVAHSYTASSLPAAKPFILLKFGKDSMNDPLPKDRASEPQTAPGNGGSQGIGVASYLRLLRQNRNFRLLLSAQIVSELGDWFYTLAIYSLLLDLTGKASSVALALVLQVLPSSLMTATAGVVNDHLRRKVVMISADLARLVIVLTMLAARSPSMVWIIYPLLFLEAVMVTFFEPARTSVVPNICAPEDVLLANTISSTTWSLNLALGASLGGVVAVLFGRDAVFLINAASFAISASLISRMRFQEPHAENRPPMRFRDLVDLSPILEGLRYVRSDARRVAMLLVKSGLCVIGSGWVLFTVMGKLYFPLHLHGLSAERSAILGMSVLLAARGLGALLGPLFSATWAGKSERRLRLGILCGFLAAAVGYTMLGFTKTLLLACATTILAHMGGAVAWVFSTTLLQLNTEDRFRGRVFAAELGFAMLSLAAAAYLAGYFLDTGIPAPRVAMATGLLMLVPSGLWFWAQRFWREGPATGD
jgi:predicted MFS family arabinose efflux permease